MKLYPCPCCDYLTFDEQLNGSYTICPVCFWEDDYIQNNDSSFSGGANNICLSEAKKNFHKYGAVEKRFISKVRKPLETEIQQI